MTKPGNPTTTTGRVTDKYGGLLAAGTSYGMVTVGLQPLPVAEARKLTALISQACDDAEAWQASVDAAQAGHDARRAAGEEGSPTAVGTIVARAHDDAPCPLTGRVTGQVDEDRLEVAWGDEQYSDEPRVSVAWLDELRAVR